MSQHDLMILSSFLIESAIIVHRVKVTVRQDARRKREGKLKVWYVKRKESGKSGRDGVRKSVREESKVRDRNSTRYHTRKQITQTNRRNEVLADS